MRTVLDVTAKAAKEVCKITANTACMFLLYQPELPERVRKLKK